ncbi:hypothetical protein KPH14_003329 [Odynerus spinipes]|uniref:Protein-lysine N-methyltransferase SMYD4 n=1 Tax=Odynerus spinipes TaxID=1348599 RepID=A0AAD9VKL5_9HYME|nr:hypothetical protein KPH14_003329 [Odynerus spinipes]
MDAFQLTLLRNITLANKSVSLTNTFKTIKNDEERVVFTLNVMKEFNAIPRAKDVPKNSKDSEKFREEGNKLFVTSPLDGDKCIEVLRLYTKSIAYAPCSSVELALAYANRSAVLLKIHKYTECIQDIDRALSLNYPDKLRAKLYVRRLECLVSIGESSIEENYKTAMHWLEKMSLDDPNRERFKTKLQQLQGQSNNLIKNNLKKQKKQQITVKSQNTEVPCASDAIAIKYNDQYGRHVIAVRDIFPGEVIAIEKPYALLLLPANIYSHCSNCLDVSWANIPCDYCTYAMYCSEKCKLEEWKKYHNIECPLFSALSNMSNYLKLDLFSTRMAIQAIREFNSFEDLRKELKEVDKCDDFRTRGFSSDKKFYTNKYRSVYSLSTNVEKRPPADLFRKSIDACFILYLLATRTAMFGDKLQENLSILAKNSDATLVGGLILKHQQIIPTNMHMFVEEYELNNRQRGVIAMPFCSLINHSCDPNVLRNSRLEHVVLYAAYPIKKGEQLLDNYGQLYAMTPKEERQQPLLKQYYFECKCVPCNEDWPLYFNLPSYKVTVKNSRNKSIITSALRKFDAYVTLATEGDVLDKPHIVQDLLKMIQVLYDHAPMPCKEMCDVIETLKRVYGLNGNRFDKPVI